MPYAYRIEGEKHHKRLLLGDGLEIETVCRIFELYADGESATTIADILNADGIPSPSGGRWVYDTIYDILERPVYVGDHRFNYESRGKYYRLTDGNVTMRQGHWIGDDQQTKVFLQETIGHVTIWTKRVGNGKAVRYHLDHGEVQFTWPIAGECSPST